MAKDPNSITGIAKYLQVVSKQMTTQDDDELLDDLLPVLTDKPSYLWTILMLTKNGTIEKLATGNFRRTFPIL